MDAPPPPPTATTSVLPVTHGKVSVQTPIGLCCIPDELCIKLYFMFCLWLTWKQHRWRAEAAGESVKSWTHASDQPFSPLLVILDVTIGENAATQFMLFSSKCSLSQKKKKSASSGRVGAPPPASLPLCFRWGCWKINLALQLSFHLLPHGLGP